MISNRIIDKEVKEIKNWEFYTQGKYPINYLIYNRIPLPLYKLNDLFLDKDYSLEEKSDIINNIFNSWRNRLKKYQSYSSTGYIFYFYYYYSFNIAVAPSNHNVNLDIPGIMISQNNISNVIKYALKISDTDISTQKYNFSQKELIKLIEKNKGSISFQTSNKLGVTRSELRNYIANNYLGPFIDQIRKKHQRRSLDLKYKPVKTYEYQVYIYKKILPKNY